jgi:hypothetical protein
MKRTLAAALITIVTSAQCMAAPLYTGMQIGDKSVGALIGCQIDKRYAIEGRYSRSDSNISHAGVTVDTATTGLGVTGNAKFPMKLNDVLPYALFVKAGWERTTNNETYTVPNTSALLSSGRITSYKNQFIFGGGAEYEFSKNFSGRIGLDLIGKDKSINLATLYEFRM